MFATLTGKTEGERHGHSHADRALCCAGRPALGGLGHTLRAVGAWDEELPVPYKRKWRAAIHTGERDHGDTVTNPLESSTYR